MLLLRRHFKAITILLITLIICLSVLLIIDGIKDKVNGREVQGFSSSIRRLRPVDVSGVVKEVASRINIDITNRNNVSFNEDAVSAVGDESDSDEWLDDDDGIVLYPDDNEDEDDVKNDAFDGEVIDDHNDGNDEDTEQIPQMNKLEQLNIDPALLKTKDKMIARQDHLHKSCDRLGLHIRDLEDPKDMSDIIDHKGNLDTLFWNDKYKFVTSVIFKSGSGNWKKFLKELAARQGNTITNFPSQLQKAKYKPDKPISILKKTPLEIKYRLKHYLKIVTVRHPLIRLLSGYRDKFIEHTDKFRKDIPKMIIDSRKGDARRNGPKHVTFPEFANFLTRNSQNLKSGDPHWTPQYIRSRPCEQNYDVIVKLETSDEDIDFVKRVVGIDDKMLFKEEYTDRHTVSNTESVVISHFQQLSEQTFQKVCDCYSLDFELFGYYRPKSVKDVGQIFEDFF
nr:carbohydrate sulfotransferase 14-like [Lytechinus pictus]